MEKKYSLAFLFRVNEKVPRPQTVPRKSVLPSALQKAEADHSTIQPHSFRVLSFLQVLSPRPLLTHPTVVDPTQGELPPLHLEVEDLSADFRIDGSTSKGNSEYVRKAGGQTTATAAANEMVQRATEEALAWERMETQQGAEAALVVSGRLLADKPLSVEALHLRGLALHLLGRWVVLWEARTVQHCLHSWVEVCLTGCLPESQEHSSFDSSSLAAKVPSATVPTWLWHRPKGGFADIFGWQQRRDFLLGQSAEKNIEVRVVVLYLSGSPTLSWLRFTFSPTAVGVGGKHRGKFTFASACKPSCKDVVSRNAR